VNWLLRAGLRRGWQKGVVGGSRAWTVVGGLALLGYLGRRALARTDDVLWSGEVAPGQVLTVQHVDES
jgi:hypothetical protein